MRLRRNLTTNTTSTTPMVTSSTTATADAHQLDILPWLKTLPLAPEYHPTVAEFQDPIAYILKIEKEASTYGICKIVPPIPAPPRKTVITNLNRLFSSRSSAAVGGSAAGSKKKPLPTFSTRQQQIGFCPRKSRPAKKPVWHSGEQYTLQQFEVKAKQFEKNQLKRCGRKGPNVGFSALEVETLFWKASMDKPLMIEYANDMPGSGFTPLPLTTMAKKWREEDNLCNVGDTTWNMRGVSRAKGSLLKFMKEDIPGVSSPMVYIAMMFSWFAWHVEDHELHSLNYMHMGASKTWYGVPRDAGLAFEEVIRIHGYGGEVNPLVTFSILSEKTTVMSPEELTGAKIPCCRLVQNAGDFVVTFPGSYHCGFSHGFNCGEAANIATPEWLKVAKEAAVRRASINYPPMISHFQLLYELALSLSSRVIPSSSYATEPRSSRLKDKMKGEGEVMVKELFVEDIIQTNTLLHILLNKGGSSSCVVVLPHTTNNPSGSTSLNSTMQLKPRILNGLCSTSSSVSNTFRNNHLGKCSRIRNGGSGPLLNSCDAEDDDSCSIIGKEMSSGLGNEGLLDQGLLSCVACGILSSACVAIIQPTPEAALRLMSSNGNSLDNQSYEPTAWSTLGSDVIKNNQEEVCRRSGHLEKGPSGLDLLASAYGNSSSDSEEEEDNINKDENNGERISAHSFNIPNSSNLMMIDSRSFMCREENRDSSRMHIFCLEHAQDVERQLNPIGGVQMMIVCYPEYPKLQAEAKLMAEEMRKEYTWKDMDFKEATEEDCERIRSALDDEQVIPTNSDWAVKIHVNLYYSSNLSRSSLYSKQLPYNAIIYKAFGQNPSSSSDGPPGEQKIKVFQRKRGRQKKIVVAGKWCGKVWMSNQVHPLLSNHKNEYEENDIGDFQGAFSDHRLTGENDDEDDDDDGYDVKEEEETTPMVASGRRKKKLAGNKAIGKKTQKTSKPSKSAPEAEDEEDLISNFENSKRVLRERKNTVRSCSNHDSPGEEEDEEEEEGNTTTKLRRKRTAAKKTHKVEKKLKKSNTKKKEEESPVNSTVKEDDEEELEEYQCDMDGCTMSFTSLQDLEIHKANICPVKDCGKKFFSHKYLVQHRRVHLDDRPLKCPWKGCKMSFKWAWARTEHIRVHTGDRPYICMERGCGQTFRFVSDFSRHKRKTGHVTKKGRR